MFKWLRNRNRQSFSNEWANTLRLHLRHYPLLDERDRQKLHQCVAVLRAERNWEGCQGLQLSDEIKVAIAGQAALMLLGTTDYFFDTVRTILVFPTSIQRKKRMGRIVHEDQVHAGEAWHEGVITLSWADVLRDTRRPGSGHNLVIHEFAHHIDGIDGEMGGSPPMSSNKQLASWNMVSQREYDQLCRRVQSGQPTLLDAYGTANRAEFFAVATETFFEQPIEFQQQHPELFDLFVDLYQQDPRRWFR